MLRWAHLFADNSLQISAKTRNEPRIYFTNPRSFLRSYEQKWIQKIPEPMFRDF